MGSLTIVLLEEKNYFESELLCREAISIQTDNSLAISPIYINLLENFVRVLVQVENYTEAEQTINLALNYSNELDYHDLDPFFVISSAQLLLNQEKLIEAEKEIEKVLNNKSNIQQIKIEAIQMDFLF